MRNQVLSSRGRFTLGICLAATLALVAAETRVAAQENQGRFINQASKRLVEMIAKANDDGFILASNQLSIGGGWLRQSTEWVTLYSVQMEGGRLYRVVAAGDGDARDVDVEILNAKQNVVAKDEKVDPTATVNYRPPVTGRYTVRARLYDARGNEPCVVLAIVMVKK
jgi:hypothetical protein